MGATLSKRGFCDERSSVLFPRLLWRLRNLLKLRDCKYVMSNILAEHRGSYCTRAWSWPLTPLLPLSSGSTQEGWSAAGPTSGTCVREKACAAFLKGHAAASGLMRCSAGLSLHAYVWVLQGAGGAFPPLPSPGCLPILTCASHPGLRGRLLSASYPLWCLILPACLVSRWLFHVFSALPRPCPD